MTWTGPGFVDAHAHALRHAAGTLRAVDAEAKTIAQWHREVAGRGSSPMDEPALDPPADLDSYLRRALQEAAAVGIVELTEAGITDWRFLDALARLRETGPLAVAVRLMVASGLAIATGAAGVAVRQTGDPWLEITGIKLYADGWLGPRTCCLSEPFADRPGDAGICFLDTDELVRRAEPFAAAGLRIHTHAIGDQAMANVLAAYERVWGGDRAAIRAAAPRIEHAQVLRPDLVAGMAELGVVACIQPSFATSDAPHVRDGLAPALQPLAYRWDALLDAGVAVVSGSDFPIEPLAPLIGLRDLVAGTALSLPTALDLMADAGAGTVTLSADPATVAIEELAAIEVLATRPNP
jgi:predicted amidohydrolase YtcJ